METKKIRTRFMEGNKDVDSEIYDVFVSEYGLKKTLDSDIDFDNAIYSNGFISAITEGLIPELKLIPSFIPKKNKEYHHVIINDECFIMYFNV